MGSAINTKWNDLERSDFELYKMLEKEKVKQLQTLELIASENYASPSALQCLGSCFNNTFCKEKQFNSESSLEKFCEKRCLEAYSLEQDLWGAEVRAYSCAIANIAVYMAICKPGDRIMGFDYREGGHYSHGHMKNKQKLTAVSLLFETFPYRLNPKTGLIDYDKLAETARLISPKVIIAGISSYSRNLDYSRFKRIADEVGAFLVADMAHIAGLVAAKLISSPFDYCDIVTTSTYKTLRGVKGAVIFYKKRSVMKSPDGQIEEYDLETKISQATFPGIIGGTMANIIASIATTMKEALSPSFKNYQTQVLLNAMKLCSGLISLGYEVVTGGTDNHMVIIDVKSRGISGLQAEFILEEININCDSVYVPGDDHYPCPNGLRLGTPSLTTRGLKEKDFDCVINFFDNAINLAKEIKLKTKSESFDDFKKTALHDSILSEKIKQLKNKVSCFAEKFPFSGHAYL